MREPSLDGSSEASTISVGVALIAPLPQGSGAHHPGKHQAKTSETEWLKLIIEAWV
ncbi:MAG: hypothetical protein ACE5Z5_05450 [Candidatus Bathyarchaeia archaeon]